MTGRLAFCTAGNAPGPLAGVPVAIKDLIDQAGLPTTCGSSFLREIPDRSATVVERLEAAGAVIIGRTGLHEFACGFSSENEWFGPVRNPVDPSTSPGGSSGGSAAAYVVMAGPDPRDPWSIDRPVTEAGGTADPAGLRIAVPHPWVDRLLESVVAAAWDRTLEDLAGAGAHVVHLDIPELDPAHLPAGGLAETARVHRRWFDEDPTRYGPEVRKPIAAAVAMGVDAYVDALHWRARVRHAAASAFREVDVLITPATATRRKVIGEPLVDAGAGPEPCTTPMGWFASLVNQIGVPALSLPVGPDGSPRTSSLTSRADASMGCSWRR